MIFFKKVNQTNTPEETIKAFQGELDALLRKYNLTIGGTPQFPIYKILPTEVELALEVLKKHNVQYTCSVKITSKK